MGLCSEVASFVLGDEPTHLQAAWSVHSFWRLHQPQNGSRRLRHSLWKDADMRASRIRIQRMLLQNYSPAEASLTAVGSSHSAQSPRGQDQHIDVVFMHHCARKDHLSVWSSSKSLDDIWPAECQKHFYHFALACTHESHHVVPNCRSCHSGPQVIA